MAIRSFSAGEAQASGFYKVVASHTGGATALANMQYIYHKDVGTSVQVVDTQAAEASVTFNAGSVGIGGIYQWYFKPTGGVETKTGITTPAYTVNGVDCAKRGRYRVEITNSIGDIAAPSATLLKTGCQ